MKKTVKKKTGWLAGGAILLALVGLLVAINLVGGEKKIERRLERMYSLDDPRFVQELGALLGPPVLGGNRYRALRNGDEIFPAMLAAIHGRAHRHLRDVHLLVGRYRPALRRCAGAKARAGVKVHVLLDWVGSAKMDPALIAEMAAAGVQIRKYHPPSWYDLGRLNNRTHRKLLVIDGRIGFTGGVGIAPQWTGHAQDPDHWRDTHFEVEGPVVAQMQAVFIDNWVKVTGDVLHGPGYFPVLSPVGGGHAQMFSSSPTGGSESMELMYLLAITAASHSIDLSASYFVPDELSQRALLDALKRGVRRAHRGAGRSHRFGDGAQRLARRMGDAARGRRHPAEYQPTMYHCKVLIVDGLLVSVGSTNFDNRSFRLNDEATLNIVDADFAAAQTSVFEADLAQSRPVSYAQWLDRPLKERLAEHLASWLGPEL